MPELSPDEILGDRLKTDAFGRNHYTLLEIDSTNRFAKKLARDGAPEGTLVYAEAQSGGRGRWGRTWHSPAGMGLWFSIVLRPKTRPASDHLLTLLGAVSVATALERTVGVRFCLQWPNDVMFGERKIAGVLTETARNEGGISHAVVGVGLNVNQTPSDFPPELSGKAASVSMAAGRPVDRFRLLPELLLQMEADYRSAQRIGYRSILERWAAYSNLIDRKIALQVNGAVEQGWVKGFHANGDLILFSEDGAKKRFSDGHVLEVGHALGD
jgi:BirA family transcriptional regulator, biotin operon repressor / biotin---[acetyl-CoA-carboxylase] ligase